MTHQNLLLRRGDAKAPPLHCRWLVRLVFLIAIFSASAQSAWADLSAGEAADFVVKFDDPITIDRPYMAFRYPSQQRQGKYDAMREIR